MSDRHPYDPNVTHLPQARPTPVISRVTGLDVAALVLGILGVVLSWVPGVNFVTGFGAVVGVVLGIVAVAKGTPKTMAWWGLSLSVIAIVLTVVVNLALASALSRVTSSGTVSGASSLAPTPSPEQGGSAKIPTWGERYTWDGGLAVEIGQPQACTPSAHAAPKVVRAVTVKITVVNGTSEAFNTALLSMMDAQFNGESAVNMVDFGEGGCDNDIMSASTVLPGGTYSFTAAYSVGAEPGTMQLALQPSFLVDKVVFVGPA